MCDKLLTREEILMQGCLDGRVMEHMKVYDAMDVPTSLLYRFYCIAGMKTEISAGSNWLFIYGKEDRWKIKLNNNSDESYVELYHNNYIPTLSGCRFFSDKYHEETMSEHTLSSALKKVSRYNYEKIHHLNCRNYI